MEAVGVGHILLKMVAIYSFQVSNLRPATMHDVATPHSKSGMQSPLSLCSNQEGKPHQA